MDHTTLVVNRKKLHGLVTGRTIREFALKRSIGREGKSEVKKVPGTRFSSPVPMIQWGG